MPEIPMPGMENDEGAKRLPHYLGPCPTCEVCEPGEFPRGKCPKAERRCGHHCSHVWELDRCCYCEEVFTDA